MFSVVKMTTPYLIITEKDYQAVEALLNQEEILREDLTELAITNLECDPFEELSEDELSKLKYNDELRGNIVFRVKEGGIVNLVDRITE